jgi:hypothetical protein
MADGPDWAALGAELPRIEARMIHDENTELRGSAFYAEVLRRLFDETAFTVRREGDFVPWDEHIRILEMNRRQDRENGERAEAALRELRERYQADLARERADLGRKLRNSAGQVESRYRREGVLLAAGWLDPQPCQVGEGAATAAGEGNGNG